MPVSPNIYRIGIFGHVGNKNLGDEALIAAVMQNIKLRSPDSIFFGYSITPDDTKMRHKIEAFPIRRDYKRSDNAKINTETDTKASFGNLSSSNVKYFNNIKLFIKNNSLFYNVYQYIFLFLKAPGNILREIVFLIKCYKRLYGIDFLIVAGSQQLIDFIEGPFGHPYNIFKWSFLAKLKRIKVIFLSVGAGPVYSRLSKIFIKYALLNASYRSYRDTSSMELMESIGVKNNRLYPDLVFSLRVAEEKTDEDVFGLPPIIAINPVPFNDPKYWPGSSQGTYEKYTGALAEFSIWLLKNGNRILFFPTQLNLDPPVIQDILIKIRNKVDHDLENNIIKSHIVTLDDLIPEISKASIVVATRFHGIIIPFVLNKPVLGIAYHGKTVDLMEYMGQSEYVVGIHDIDFETLRNKYLLLEKNKKDAKRIISRNVSKFRKELDFQYSQALGSTGLKSNYAS